MSVPEKTELNVFILKDTPFFFHIVVALISSDYSGVLGRRRVLEGKSGAVLPKSDFFGFFSGKCSIFFEISDV